MAAASARWADGQNPAYRPPPADRTPPESVVSEGFRRIFETSLTAWHAREYKARAWEILGGCGGGMGMSGECPESLSWRHAPILRHLRARDRRQESGRHSRQVP